LSEIMPSVLHIITSIDRGGAENHLAELLQGQAGRGLRVTVGYLKGNGYWRSTLERAGIEVVPLAWSGYLDTGIVGRVRSLLLRVQPDYLHAHLPAAEVFTRLAWRGSGSPARFIISKHSDDPISTPLFWLGGFFAERAAQAVIAISGAVARYLRVQHRLPEGRVHTIHYGLSPAAYDRVTAEEIAAVRRGWGVGPDELLVGTVARIVPQKRIDLLIEAVASLRGEGLPLRFVVVGGGAEEAALRRRAEQLGVSAAVVWAGRREDIPAVMQALDIFALCSDYEGFGLVLLEAMASRRPVVATRVSAIPEIVRDGETGVLCRAGDAVGIADAIRSLADSGRRNVMGVAGRQRLEREFTVDKMVDSTLAVYERTGKL
jgi:glycosyltransferase involved in cell wall biosynthesis